MFSSRQDDMGSSLTALQRKTIASLESRIEQIALLPSVVARLAALDFDSPTAPDEVVALIRSDPPLSLRLMRLANSSVAGGGGIDTISGAILRVGVQGLAGLVLALSVVEVSYPTREANGTFGFIPSRPPWLPDGWPRCVPTWGSAWRNASWPVCSTISAVLLFSRTGLRIWHSSTRQVWSPRGS